MTPALLSAIRAHAALDYPREACGLLVLHAGTEAEYVPCRNTGDLDQFILHPEDWAACEDSGTIIGVVHSHPDGTTQPSEADRLGCAASGLPWWIVAGEDWARMPTALPLEGRAFAWGIQDCFTLIGDWWAAQGIALPEFVRAPKFWETSDLYLDNLALAGFEITDQVEYGDGVLFSIRGHGVTNHAGIYLGEGRMLHHLPGRLSIAESIGAWAQSLTHIVRRCA